MTERIEWQLVLARRQPGKALAASSVVLGLLIVIHTLWGSGMWTGIAAALFACAIGDFYLPMRLSVGPDGVSVLGFFQRQRLSWDRVAGFRSAEEGIWLEAKLGLQGRGRRGLFLWLGPEQPRVLQAISHYLPSSGEAAQ